MPDSSWGDIEARVDRELAILTKGIGAAADMVSARRELRRMARPSTVADRLKALKATIEAESDKLLTEIEAIASNKVPAAFAKGRAFLDQQNADVAAMESELAQLTNLPLGP